MTGERAPALIGLEILKHDPSADAVTVTMDCFMPDTGEIERWTVRGHGGKALRTADDIYAGFGGGITREQASEMDRIDQKYGPKISALIEAMRTEQRQVFDHGTVPADFRPPEGAPIIDRLEAFMRHNGANVGLMFSAPHDHTPFSVASEYGEEAPDSPMAGGAVYGMDSSLEAALDTALKDARF